MGVFRLARIDFGRTLLLVGVLTLTVLCAPGQAGGKKVTAATNYQFKDLWRGAGPAWSPDGSPPGLTIVHAKAAWTRIIAAFGPPYDAHANLPVDWAKDVILFVQANEDNPSTEVHLKSLSGDGKSVTVTATLRASPKGQPSLGVEARPWIIASAPAAAFAGNPAVRLTIDGRELPVTNER